MLGAEVGRRSHLVTQCRTLGVKSELSCWRTGSVCIHWDMGVGCCSKKTGGKMLALGEGVTMGHIMFLPFCPYSKISQCFIQKAKNFYLSSHFPTTAIVFQHFIFSGGCICRWKC